MASLTAFITQRLKLKVNGEKSAVARPVDRKFSGLQLTSEQQPRRRIAPKAIMRFKERVRELTSRTRGVSLAKDGGGTLHVLARLAKLLWLLPNAPAQAGHRRAIGGADRWQRPRSTSREFPGSRHRAAQCLLRLARASAVSRFGSAQPAEPPDADPHVRWCGRGARVARAPMPIAGLPRILRGPFHRPVIP